VAEARGARFVTLEGPDGAGKSSQARGLADWLRSQGLTVTLTREPGGTPLGEGIRELLLHGAAARGPRSDALLFAAARAEHVTRVIAPALERGEIVVCDRYGDSTLAYQGYGGGEDPTALRSLVAYATGGLGPSLTLLLDVPVEVGLGRRSGGPAAGQTRFEDDALHDRAFHERVRAGFLALAAAEPERWRIVDAARSPAEVAAAVEAAVRAWLEGPSVSRD
jgi:dTMP kinase